MFFVVKQYNQDMVGFKERRYKSTEHRKTFKNALLSDILQRHELLV